MHHVITSVMVGLTGATAPAVFRRRAIGRMPAFDTTSAALEYPLRQFAHLQVSLIMEQPDGTKRVTQNRCRAVDEESLEGSLKAAQAEVVQQEIFSVLIKEASNLSTATARVSERLIALEAAQGVELRFELVSVAVSLTGRTRLITASRLITMPPHPPPIHNLTRLATSSYQHYTSFYFALTHTSRSNVSSVLPPPFLPPPLPPPCLRSLPHSARTHHHSYSSRSSTSCSTVCFAHA